MDLLINDLVAGLVLAVVLLVACGMVGIYYALSDHYVTRGAVRRWFVGQADVRTVRELSR